MTYRPRPVDTEDVALGPDLHELTEQLALNVHELWAQERLAQGWRWGPQRSDERRQSPQLVPYHLLSEADKQIDRETALGTLKAILALGYRIERPQPTGAAVPPVPAGQPNPKSVVNKFDEYKFFAQSTQFLTERRQSASQIFLGVNTALLAVLGVLVKDTQGALPAVMLAGTSVAVMGILVSWLWRKALSHYQGLIGWRYAELMKMEANEALAGCHAFYTKEWKEYFEPGARKPGFSFSKLEAWLPAIFAVIYISYLVTGLIVSVQ